MKLKDSRAAGSAFGCWCWSSFPLGFIDRLCACQMLAVAAWKGALPTSAGLEWGEQCSRERKKALAGEVSLL